MNNNDKISAVKLLIIHNLSKSIDYLLDIIKIQHSQLENYLIEGAAIPSFQEKRQQRTITKESSQVSHYTESPHIDYPEYLDYCKVYIKLLGSKYISLQTWNTTYYFCCVYIDDIFSTLKVLANNSACSKMLDEAETCMKVVSKAYQTLESLLKDRVSLTSKTKKKAR